MRQRASTRSADGARRIVCIGVGALGTWLWATTVLGQSVLDRPANLAVERVTLPEALLQLQRTAQVALVYSPDLLPPDLRVSCSCRDQTVGEVLRRFFRGTDLSATAVGSLIRIVPGHRRAGSAEAVGVVVGRVTGSFGGPVVNAMAQLSGGRGVLSDGGGRFVLRGVSPGVHRLVVTSIGWRAEGVDTVRVVAGDTARVTVRMVPEVIPLPEVLVAPGAFGLLEQALPGTARTLLTRDELQTRPQIGEDVFRAMKRLPGVASHDISTRLDIRGGLDREVLVRLDGVELQEPYHLGDWGGALGIVDLNALGGAEVTAGGFGVEFGDRLTAVLDMTSRTAVGAPTTTLGLSVSNLTAMSRGGFADDRGSWLVSARRGFMDLVMALIGESDRLSPSYYDVFAKVRYQVAPHHLLSIHALRAGDTFLLQDTPSDGPDAIDFQSDWGSTYGWATWDAAWGAVVSTRTTGWFSRLSRHRWGRVDDANEDPSSIQVDDARAHDFGGVRSDLSVELAPRVLLKLGAEVARSRADYDYAGRTWHPIVTEAGTHGVRVDSTDVETGPEGTEVAAYAALRVRPRAAWTIEAGMRYDRASHTGDRGPSPRLLTAVEVAPGTTLRSSWGIYRQPEAIHELSVGDGETTFHPWERAEQVAMGLEREMGGGTVLRVEAYRRVVRDPRPQYLNAEQELQIFPELAGDRLRIEPERTRARGLELVLEGKASPRWAWSASYVLAQAEDDVDGVWIPRRYDQRHTVGLFAAYRPDLRWSVTTSWQYHTGWPATTWGFQVQPLEDGWNHWTRTFGPIRGARLPAYHRLDVRVSRSFDVHGNTLDAFVDLFNVYGRVNLAGYDFTGAYEQGRVTVARGPGQELLPFLPTFGVRFEF